MTELCSNMLQLDTFTWSGMCWHDADEMLEAWGLRTFSMSACKPIDGARVFEKGRFFPCPHRYRRQKITRHVHIHAHEVHVCVMCPSLLVQVRYQFCVVSTLLIVYCLFLWDISLWAHMFKEISADDASLLEYTTSHRVTLLELLSEMMYRKHSKHCQDWHLHAGTARRQTHAKWKLITVLNLAVIRNRKEQNYTISH